MKSVSKRCVFWEEAALPRVVTVVDLILSRQLLRVAVNSSGEETAGSPKGSEMGATCSLPSLLQVRAASAHLGPITKAESQAQLHFK